MAQRVTEEKQKRADRAAIRAAAIALGLAGRPLCVHSSLSSFGHVVGGAPAVVAGLLDAGCTVVVPSASWDTYSVIPSPHQLPDRNGGDAAEWLSYFDSLTEPRAGAERIYHPDTEVIDPGMGAIPAAVVATPGRVRGDHPLFSFAAVGPLARQIIEPQSPLDVFAPLRVLAELDGVVVLMGVDLTKVTLLHLAEEMAGRIPFRRWANGADGEPTEVGVGGCSDGFERFAPLLRSIERTATVGESPWRVYPAREMLSLGVRAIQEDPEITRCDEPRCERCRDAILGGPLLNVRPYEQRARI